jgi:hypothetical protein
MPRPRCCWSVRLLTCLVMAACRLPALGAEPSPGSESITFEDTAARRTFLAYVVFLEQNRDKFADELATLRQLERSEVNYHVGLGAFVWRGVEGGLTTDGVRVYITVSARGGPCGEIASMNSRFAHEFEHARQFDDAELAFTRDPETGQWRPEYASYDIGDEVKAWRVQMKTSISKDLWMTREGDRRPSLLQKFATAGTDRDRARVLVACGYGKRNPRTDSNVVVSSKARYGAGQLLRPNGQRNFFGRVHSVSRGSEILPAAREGDERLRLLPGPPTLEAKPEPVEARAADRHRPVLSLHALGGAHAPLVREGMHLVRPQFVAVLRSLLAANDAPGELFVSRPVAHVAQKDTCADARPSTSTVRVFDCPAGPR